MTFALPFVAALALGAVGIGRQAWRDEHATWWAATMPLPELWERLSHVDVVLAPYYLFMRAWTFIAGDSVVAMRVPSLVAMAVAAGLTGLLGARLFNVQWAGVVGGLLFAVLPSVSRYAQEARPYALAMCFAIATVLALLRRRWVLLTVFVTLTGFAHLLALLVLLAHLPLLSSRAVGEWGELVPVRRWLLAVGVGLAPVVPLVLLGARQASQVAWIDASWKSLATLPISLTRSATAAGILAALALLGVITARWGSRAVAMLVVWAVAPPVLVFAIAPDYFYYRYLLFTLPAWTLLAALGAYSAVRALSGRRQVVAAAAICAAVLLLGAPDHRQVRRSPLAGDQDYQGAASYVSSRMDVGDEVLFDGYQDRRERFGFAYELRQRVAPALCPEISTCAGRRVWLVSNVSKAIPAGFRLVEAKSFPGIELRLVARG